MFISRLINLTQSHDQKFNNFKQLTDFTLHHNWSPFVFKDNYRTGENWSSCDVMVLDIDNDDKSIQHCTIEEAKELFKEYNHIIVTTKSHQVLKHGNTTDRFRVIIPLSSTIIDKEIYKNTWYYLANRFPFIDQTCKDFARFYYQSKSFVYENPGKPINPVTVNVMPTVFEKPRLELMLTKGKLSRATMEFIINGAAAGGRNISCFKAAKDLQEQGYTLEEAVEKLSKSPCLDKDFSEDELERTVSSAFTNDPKHDPRGLSEKTEYIASSIFDLECNPDLYKQSEPICGPNFLDVTQEKWRKGEVLGVVAGSGTGKTALSLKIIRDIIYNNSQNDDIHFFFSLEMPARQIVQRWHKLVGKDPSMSRRLFVIDNKNSDERLTWQHIVKFVQDTCKQENKKAGAVLIDHFMALSDKIDITKEPNFDVSTDIMSGRGKIKSINTKEMCRLMKVIAEMLGCFLIIQNQSTIERAGHGDTPMGLNAAYGAAQFAWFCDYIITVWQPLKRVQNETMLTCSAWQYSKIREVGLNDLTRVYIRHHLYYDLSTGDFRQLSQIEEEEFNKMVEKANMLRRSDEKNQATQYQGSPARDNYPRLLKLAKEKAAKEIKSE